MSTERDADLAKLAGLRGWRLFIPPTGRRGFRAPYFDLNPRSVGAPCEIPIPAPDAPLPEAMEFVGRLCVDIGVQTLTVESPGQTPGDGDWWVSFWIEAGQPEAHRGIAPDLAWAAVRAAIAAREGGAT